MKSSWKTTAGGVLSGAGLLFAAKFPEFARWGELAAGIGTILLGLAARDNNVTSEQAGASEPSSRPGPGLLGKLPLLFLCLGLVLPFGTGCQSANKAAYQAQSVQRLTVTEALSLWDGYVASGQATLEQQRAVKNAWLKWQAADVALCDAGKLFAASTVTNANGDSGARAALEQAAVDLAQDTGDLQNLFVSFGLNVSLK